MSEKENAEEVPEKEKTEEVGEKEKGEDVVDAKKNEEAKDGDDEGPKSGERPNSGGRKSLEGLSPSQDAKVGTLKQMFQDYDNEVLCSILFEQCSGDLDKSIETILKMQTVKKEGEGAETDGKEPSLGSSLADTEETDKDKEKEGSKDVDKATQELIDEMIAEDEQSIMEAE